MSAQIGFARSNILPRDNVPEAVVVPTTATVGEQQGGQRVLCIEVSEQNLQKMQALFHALSNPSPVSHEGQEAILMQRAHRQLRLMGRTLVVPDASTTTVLELKQRLLNADPSFLDKEGVLHSVTVQLMALRRPLASRVAAAATTEEMERVRATKSSNSNNGLETDNAELVVLPEGMPVSLLLAESENAQSPLHLFVLPPLPSKDGTSDDTTKDLVIFYTQSETFFGVDWGKVCACACCAVCIAGCCALLCCCCKGSGDKEAQPQGNTGNPYNGG